MTRAGFSDISITLAEEIDSLLPDGCASEGWCDLTSHGLLSHATQDQVYGNHPGAVVFPLLALADVLEDGTDRGEQ